MPTNAEIKANRLEAMASGSSTYIGKPCSTCDGTTRYLSNRNCVSCTKSTKKRERSKEKSSRKFKGAPYTAIELLTGDELILVIEITERWNQVCKVSFGRMASEVTADQSHLASVHIHGCMLDLLKLLESPKAEFVHDMRGIHECFDKATGKRSSLYRLNCARKE
jgi:hypothetical protein